jgi:hypothetical protein
MVVLSSALTMTRKERITSNFRHNIFVKLAPSKVAFGGVGVFAVVDIPENTDPFVI